MSVWRTRHRGGARAANVRHELTESVRRRIEEFAKIAPGKTKDAKRRAAIASWSAMVGALVLSRIVDDPPLSNEILADTRESIKDERRTYKPDAGTSVPAPGGKR